MKAHHRIEPGKAYKYHKDGHTFIGQAGTPILQGGVWVVTLLNSRLNVSITVPVEQVTA